MEEGKNVEWDEWACCLKKNENNFSTAISFLLNWTRSTQKKKLCSQQTITFYFQIAYKNFYFVLKRDDLSKDLRKALQNLIRGLYEIFF